MLPPRFLRLLALFASAPLFAACGYGDHRHDDYYGNGAYGNGAYGNGSSAPATIEQATIDVDQSVAFDAGAGPGVYVAYDTGGTYHVSTSCESTSGVPCYWDILVTPLDGASVASVSPVDLESDDSVAFGSGNQVRFVAYTGGDVDGFTLQTDPGAAVEIDALLEGVAANSYLLWVGDGALNRGAPSNPIDLVPSAN